MFNSQRKFAEIHLHHLTLFNIKPDKVYYINNKALTTIGEVLKKFAENVRVLTFSLSVLTDDQLMFLLSCLTTSKLSELNITSCGIVDESLNNYPANMIFPQLTKIDFSNSNYGHPFQKKSISLSSSLYKFFKVVQSRSKLRDLTASVPILKLISLNDLNLSRLCIQKGLPANIRLSSIISRQNSLMTLDLSDCFFMEDVFNEVLQLKSLNVLKINLRGITMKGFLSLSKLSSLFELHISCGNTPWIMFALSMCEFTVLSALHLDIKDLEFTSEQLFKVLKINLRELSIVTSNFYVLSTVFSSANSHNLEVLSIEIHPDGSKEFDDSILTSGFQNRPKLREFKLVNKNLKFVEFVGDVGYCLARLPNLEKLHIEGFRVNNLLLSTAIEDHFNLAELVLITHEEQKSEYVFDDVTSNVINAYGGKLKSIKISCALCTYQNSKKFPVNLRDNKLQILRRR